MAAIAPAQIERDNVPPPVIQTGDAQVHHAVMGVGLDVKILKHERAAIDLETRQLAVCPYALESEFEIETL